MTGKQRIYQSSEECDFPQVDLLTLLFEHENPNSYATEETKLHIECADPSNYMTRAQCRTLLRQIAAGLRKHFGVGANGPNKDVVIVSSAGQILVPAVFYGVVAAGGVYSAASAGFTVDELVRQVKQGESNLIICSEETREVATAAAAKCNIPQTRVCLLSSKKNAWSLSRLSDGLELIGKEELEWERIRDPERLKQSMICLLYSSGTTGPPKGVMLSHSNIVAECTIPMAPSLRYMRSLKKEDQWEYRTLAHLPTAHIAGLMSYIVNPTYVGGPTYWMPKFEFPDFVKYCKVYSITSFFSVPPIYLGIAKTPSVTDQFKSLKVVISGAAPLGPELQAEASAKIGGDDCYISQLWGLTETTGALTFQPWDAPPEKTGSVCPPLPGTQIRLVDDDLNDVEPGKPGEIIVKAPTVSNGYFRNPQATKESFTADGWYMTGDIGIFRNPNPNDPKSQELLYIVDRKKELIKYKGSQVAPAELEALLLTHPGILDAAVIGVHDDKEHTEVPRAYVVRHPAAVAKKQIVSEDEVKIFVKKVVSAYKQLRGGVKFVDAIPKNASGKILRREIREWAKKEDRSNGARL